MSNEKISFVVVKENLQDFTSKIGELAKIDSTIKIKIDKENIFMYSLEGDRAITAFKSFILKTTDYFKYKEEFNETYSLIVLDAKLFINNLSVLSTKIDKNITVQLAAKQTVLEDKYNMSVRSFKITDTRFNFTEIGGEAKKLKDIPKELLETKLDVDNCAWSFTITSEDFKDIKKLSKINSDEVLSISVVDKMLKASQLSKWTINLGEMEEMANATVTFNKKYLSLIRNDEESLTLYVYDTFLLYKKGEECLMLSFEHG